MHQFNMCLHHTWTAKMLIYPGNLFFLHNLIISGENCPISSSYESSLHYFLLSLPNYYPRNLVMSSNFSWPKNIGSASFLHLPSLLLPICAIAVTFTHTGIVWSICQCIAANDLVEKDPTPFRVLQIDLLCYA